MPNAIKEHQFRATLNVDGVDWGVWDGVDGGELDSEASTYRPGGMEVAYALGGMPAVGNVTLKRIYVLDRDHVRAKEFRARTGKARCTVRKQPLDVDGNVFGEPDVYTGILKRVSPPTHDSTGDGEAMIEVEIVCDGAIG